MDSWYLSGSDSAYSETAQLSTIEKTAHRLVRVSTDFPAAWALSLLTVGQDWHLRQKSEVHRKEVHIPSAVQEKSRQQGSKRYETVSLWVGSYTICRCKGFTEFSSNIPKQRSEIRKASKKCLEAKARKSKEGTSTSRKGREVHEVVSEVGIRGNLDSDFVNTTRVHHGSTQATQNRLPKHLWGLSTNHLLWSYRSRDLDQTVCRAPPPWERKAALTAVSHSTGKGDAYGFGTGEGCFPHSKHRNEAGKFEKQRMGRHCFCLQNSSIFLLAVFH